METRRLFIGIGLSSPLAKRLEREQASMADGPFILTRRANLHVTVLFLGFVAEDNLHDILPAIETAAREASPFELHFDRIGYFPDTEHPTVVYLTGKDNDALLALRQNLDRELGYLVPEKKSFRPHVTLAKIRRGQFEKLATKPACDKAVNFVEPVSSVTLFESTTQDGKRVFLPLEEFPLGQ